MFVLAIVHSTQRTAAQRYIYECPSLLSLLFSMNTPFNTQLINLFSESPVGYDRLRVVHHREYIPNNGSRPDLSIFNI